MGKQADAFILCEPFAIAARGFEPERNAVEESLFSLANEYMGVRGYPEEGTRAPGLLGSYFGGVYEWGEEARGAAYRGVVTRTHYMVCCADWLHTRLWVDGERIWLSEANPSFEARLDLQTGVFSRRYCVRLASGAGVQVCFERILGMERAHCAAQRIRVTCDREAELLLTLGVDGGVPHAATGSCLWRKASCRQSGSRGGIALRTATTDQEVAYLFEALASGTWTPWEEERGAGFSLQARLRPGETFAAERRCLNLVNPVRWDLQALDNAPSFEALLAENRAHYARFWRECDVEIAGDEAAQQGIRFCLFQLHQTYRGLDGTHNIGAKGLTGEAYNGHAFWDSETYCLPYYLLNDPDAAKGLLLYRYRTLPQARARARALDCQGACYPIATLNGEEACTLWQHASLQMQPSTAVAYAILLYARMTGDRAFLHHEGIEMLVEICRYVVSRGGWNRDQSGFGFWGVMGPDEFHMMVNNDFYTNYMGQKTLEGTLAVLETMPDADRFATPQERESWRNIAAHMLYSRDSSGVFEQQDGFFTLPHLDVHSIPLTDFPLYDHWSYDRIYRTDMIKQPDVLMAMFLHPEDFTLEQLRVNYDYYEPRCIHESSLSPSVHAVLASRLGRDAAAFDFFGFATRMDLDNYNRNTGSGLHMTSIAAAWITIVFGFGGLTMEEETLSLRPRLPAAWQACSFRLRIRGSVVRLAMDKDGCRLTLIEGEPVRLRLNGALVTVR